MLCRIADHAPVNLGPCPWDCVLAILGSLSSGKLGLNFTSVTVEQYGDCQVALGNCLIHVSLCNKHTSLACAPACMTWVRTGTDPTERMRTFNVSKEMDSNSRIGT